IGVVDQPLPADGGTRLLEIYPHDQIEAVADFGGQLLEPAGIVLGGFHVVDGAGADDDEQALVLAVEISRITWRLSVMVASAALLMGILALSWAGVIIASLEATFRSLIGKSAIFLPSESVRPANRQPVIKWRTA